MTGRFHVSPLVQDVIAGRLAASAGVEPALLDASRMNWVIASRCRSLGLTGAETYLEHLQSNAGEITALIDSLVIHETSFFRDIAAFEQIVGWAREWAGRLGTETPGGLRVLSAPCSTGQEAYSLAVALRLAGLDDSAFTVDAMDISAWALRTAERGVYAEGTMRAVPPSWQAACATLRDGQWHIHEPLRRRVRFARRNLAMPQALAGEHYHLILCRNLFIYFNPLARAALAQSLAQALLPGGRLIVGSADRVREVEVAFDAVRPASSFAWTVKSTSNETAALPLSQTAAAPSAEQPQASALPVQTAVQPVPRHPAHGASAAEFYRRALEHFENGNLRNAERRCRQALYLAPSYLPALELLEELWRPLPDPRLRRALTERIQRVRTERLSLRPAAVSVAALDLTGGPHGTA